jgi:hypothetical protein
MVSLVWCYLLPHLPVPVLPPPTVRPAERHTAYCVACMACVVRGTVAPWHLAPVCSIQYPRSVTEFSPGKVLYQHVSIYLHAGMFVCLSEGCKPEFWIGRSGGAAKNACPSFCLSVCLSQSQAPWPGSPVPSLQSPVIFCPFLFPPELSWWASIACRVWPALLVYIETVSSYNWAGFCRPITHKHTV